MEILTSSRNLIFDIILFFIETILGTQGGLCLAVNGLMLVFLLFIPDQNNSYEITINGYQVRKRSQISDLITIYNYFITIILITINSQHS